MTYMPRIKDLEIRLKEVGSAVTRQEIIVENKHSYLTGLCQRPYNTKMITFSGEEEKYNLANKISKKAEERGSLQKKRTQKVYEYYKVLKELVELKEKYLESLKNEEFEIDIAPFW